MTDPIADLLNTLKNASLANHRMITVQFSNLKEAIAHVLQGSKFIGDIKRVDEENRSFLEIYLLPHRKLNVKKISKPGRRMYISKDQLPKVKSGLGIAIVSTSQGVMTNKEAAKKGLGGELLCEIY